MLDLGVEERDGSLIVQIAGPELGADCAADLRDALLEKLDQNPWAVLDLSGVGFMDSSALGVVVAALKSVRGRGELRLVGVQPRIEELFRLTGLNRVFSFESCVDSALLSLVASRERANSA